MEIRNNTPSFGMAFKVDVTGDASRGLANYLFDGQSASVIARRKKGLAELIKKHKNDFYRDIEYTYRPERQFVHQVLVKPRHSNEVEHNICVSGYVNHKERTLRAYDRVTEEQCQSNLDLLLRRICRPFVELKENIYMQMHPIESLPANLRDASDYVAKLEKLQNQAVKNENEVISIVNKTK